SHSYPPQLSNVRDLKDKCGALTETDLQAFSGQCQIYDDPGHPDIGEVTAMRSKPERHRQLTDFDEESFRYSVDDESTAQLPDDEHSSALAHNLNVQKNDKSISYNFQRGVRQYITCRPAVCKLILAISMLFLVTFLAVCIAYEVLS
ncbi:MAG: hypothetical protein ACRDL7_10925, partial [Gaiellaceae bacterium]